MPVQDDSFPAKFSRASGSIGNFGPLHLKFRPNHAIEFIAHGEGVRIAAAGGGYITSFATPAISGIWALLRGAFPDLRPFEVKSILLQ